MNKKYEMCARISICWLRSFREAQISIEADKCNKWIFSEPFSCFCRISEAEDDDDAEEYEDDDESEENGGLAEGIIYT